LLKYFWWGSVFLVNVPFVIVGVIAILILVPDSKDPRPGRLDPSGILLSMAGLGVLVYGIIEGGNSNEWLRWDTLGAILLGVLLLALFVILERRSTHPTIDINLFKNRHFAGGGAVIALTFFALMGSTFYLAYYLQAVKGYTALTAGVALIAVAVAMMIAAPLSSRLTARFGTRYVAGFGLIVVAISMLGYGATTETTPQWIIEIIMFAMGAGMGVTMAPATTAIMSAVPREKAGAGAAINNTVRQVAGALGVAVLGSILAVVYRGQLGSDAPANLAARLDQPPAVVSQLPESAQVTPLVRDDTSQSIGASLEFIQKTGAALQQRGRLLAGQVSPAQAQQARAHAEQAIGQFFHDSKDSFVTAMHVTSLVAALADLLGAAVAFTFLPGRPRRRAPTEESELVDAAVPA
jgi:MFS family permease